MSTPSFSVLLLKVSLLGQAPTTFSTGITIPNSARNACIVQANKVVALVLDKAGKEERPVAIKLRATGDLKEVCLLLFLKNLCLLSHASHFFSIIPILDFDTDMHKLEEAFALDDASLEASGTSIIEESSSDRCVSGVSIEDDGARFFNGGSIEEGGAGCFNLNGGGKVSGSLFFSGFRRLFI